MDKRQFERLAEEAFDSLPQEILGYVDNVVFLIEDWPDRETLDALGIPRPHDLLGLYQGHPLSERSTLDTGVLPDRIVLYQRPIELHAAREGSSLAAVIRDTLLHEVGHHFGLDEDTLARLETCK